MAEVVCEIVAGRDLEFSELEALAQLHVRCLPGSIYSKMGLGVTRCLYRYMAVSDVELFVVARDAERRVVGASISSLSPRSLLRRLVFGSSMGLRLTMRVHRIPWGALFANSRHPMPQLPELMFLFVDSRYRGNGTGARLVAMTESQVRARGVRSLTVMTEDELGNRATAFYRRAGYTAKGTVVKYAKQFVLFVRDLD